MSECVCVCVCEREREGERESLVSCSFTEKLNMNKNLYEPTNIRYKKRHKLSRTHFCSAEEHVLPLNITKCLSMHVISCIMCFIRVYKAIHVILTQSNLPQYTCYYHINAGVLCLQ